MKMCLITANDDLKPGDILYDKNLTRWEKLTVRKVTKKYFYVDGSETRYSREGYITTDEYKRPRVYKKAGAQ